MAIWLVQAQNEVVAWWRTMMLTARRWQLCAVKLAVLISIVGTQDNNNVILQKRNSTICIEAYYPGITMEVSVMV